jgi:lipopolysaccharide/colanic/teichoic acid biosynthesis glycosyltransferase
MHVEMIREEASPAVTTVKIISGVHRGIPHWADASIALVGLVVAFPFLALIALAIAVSSSGPVLFRQKRVGQHGRLFELYKFCTMTPSSDGPQVTSSNDQRITPLGRFLRRSKLDELPTLWNVLKGEMALVGPRPEVPRYVKLEDPIWQTVLAVRPGITDPVTLSLRNEEELLAQVKTDTEKYYVEELQPTKLSGYVAYLEERSWRTDVRVLLSTLAAVVRPSRGSQNGCS